MDSGAFRSPPQQQAYPRFEWGLDGATAIAAAADVAVIVDVLSFTTTLSVAIDLGTEVWPYRCGGQRAAEHARRHDAVLAVSRSTARALAPKTARSCRVCHRPACAGRQQYRVWCLDQRFASVALLRPDCASSPWAPRVAFDSRWRSACETGWVRALLAFAGGSGHFLPTLPVARALAAAGHDVLYTCQSGMLGAVRRAGFEAVDSGGRTLAAPGDRRPLVVADRSDEVAVISTVFAGWVARERAKGVTEVGRWFCPDVVVCDEVDFGAAVAAESLGVPHAAVTVLASGAMITPGLLDEPLAKLRQDVGLPPRAPAFLEPHLTLVPVMPSFREPSSPLPARALAFRPDVLADGVPVERDAGVGRWLAERANRPLVYFTLGTVFHQESGDLFPRVLRGLEQLPLNVVVTVGRELDPSDLGPHGDHVLIQRFVPQRELLPRCSAVVSHAGSGTVVSSLACGVPLVLLPMGADQPFNADRCLALGVGRVLDALTASPDDVRDAVDDVLTAPSYRAAAARLRAEAEALPSVQAAADAVVALTR